MPTKTAGIALLVLILAPWANTSFAASQDADHFSDRSVLPALPNDLSLFADFDGDFKDDGKNYIAPDSLSSELPPAYVEEEAGKPFVIGSASGCRDLDLYLFYLRERGPPL